MSFRVAITIALRALRIHVLRTSLTLLGIIIGVAAVVIVMAVGSGSQLKILERIQSLGANLLFVTPSSAAAGGVRFGHGTRHTLTDDDADAIRRELPLIVASAPLVSATKQIVRGNLNWATLVQGTTLDYFATRDWPLTAGRLFTHREVASAAKVAVLGATVAEELFQGVDPLGQIVRVSDIPFTVIGVLASKGPAPQGTDQDDKIVIPLLAAQIRVMGSVGLDRKSVESIYVKVGEGSLMKEARELVRGLLRQRHQLHPSEPDDFVVYDLAEVQASMSDASDVLTFWLAVVALVSLVVGGVNIMNMMLVAVTERTREIGLRLAVGARQRDIRNQFLIEAMTLSLLGATSGVILGLAGTMAITALGGLPVVVTPGMLLLATGFAAITGVVFGFYPAHKASGLDPMTALRFE